MRKRFWILVLLSAFAVELCVPAPAPAQFMRGEATIVETYHQRKKRRQRAYLGIGVAMFLVLLGGTYIVMNALDKRAAQEKLRRRMLEQQQERDLF